MLITDANTYHSN